MKIYKLYKRHKLFCRDSEKDEDEDDSFHLLDQTSEEIVPDAEFDRRKGLGPLQVWFILDSSKLLLWNRKSAADALSLF